MATFGTWNFFDGALESRSSGHHFSETKALSDELVRRGKTVRLYCYRDPPTGRFPGAETIPTFSVSPYISLSDDPVWSAMENFIVHNRVYDRDLQRLDAASFHNGLTVFPTIDLWQLMGLLRWLGRFDASVRPKAAVNLFPLRNWSFDNINARLIHTTWKECPQAVKDCVKLCVRERESVDRFEPILGHKPHFLPSPLGPIGRRGMARKTIDPEAPMNVAYVGGARPERGAALVPEIARQCASDAIRFFVQFKEEHPDIAAAPFHALSENLHIRLHRGMLAEDAYYDAVVNSVVLLPYQPNIYGIKSSGVYVEAKFLGAPVIVPAGSWMADDVRKYGNGLVFEEWTPSCIAACVLQARRDIVRLREAAARLGDEFSAWNGADRCIEATEALFD